MTTLTSDRLVLVTPEILTQRMCTTSRVVGAVVVPGNYGIIDQYNQLIIPASNVGTLLTFPSKVKDYLYLDIAFSGAVAAISVQTPTTNLGMAAGVIGVVAGEYTVRIPYCGPIQSITFMLNGYYVKSIRAAYVNPYVVTSRDLTQLTLGDTAGWTDNGVSFTRNIANGANISIYTGGTLLTGSAGLFKVEALAATGLPLLTPGYTFFDGVNTFTNYTFAALTPYFEITNGLAYVNFNNTTGVTVTMKVTPTILKFSPISTTYGSS